MCIKQLSLCNKVGNRKFIYIYLYNLLEFSWYISGRKAKNLILQGIVGKGTGVLVHGYTRRLFSSVQSSPVTKQCSTLWNLMDYSTPVFPVLNISWSLFKLLSIELVIPSNHLILCCPLLLLPSIFPNIKGFFLEWVGSSHQLTRVLELELQHQSFQKSILDWFILGLTSLIALLPKGLSRVFSNTTV